MRPFEHIDATSIEDALGLLREEPESALIAGGTDLLPLMKDRLIGPRLLINLKQIDGLNRIEAVSSGGLSIGALATMSAVGENAMVQRNFPILAQAVRVAASPQLRNLATVGGNLCQRPRCWYYRGSFECALNGGSRCLAPQGRNRDAGIFGGGDCHAVNPSDLAPALVALGAAVVVQKAKARRAIPLDAFFTAPTKGRLALNSLNRDEMIVAVMVPRPAAGSQGIYLKAMERKTWAFAQTSVAIQVSRQSQRVDDVRIVLGGVAPVPWRATVSEDVLRANTPAPELIERVADAAVQGASPLSGNGFKVRLARELVKRGLAHLLN